jgi:hypothetical protein
MGLKELIFGGAVKGYNDAGGEFEGSIQDWLPVKNIIGGTIITKDHRFVKIIELLPVNFHLKTPHEQQTIIYYFASYLKIAPNSLQVRVVTQRLDLESYVAQMRRHHDAEEIEKCKDMIEDNISEVTYIVANEMTSHRFFIIFQYEPQMKGRGGTVRAIADKLNEEADTARRYLDLCGLEMLEPDFADNAVLELLYETINKSTARRVKLPDGVFDMMTAVHGIYTGQ